MLDLDFFGALRSSQSSAHSSSSRPRSGPPTSTTQARPGPSGANQQKPKRPSSGIVVTTTRRVVASPAQQQAVKRPSATLNGLPEEKRRRIAAEREAAAMEKAWKERESAKIDEQETRDRSRAKAARARKSASRTPDPLFSDDDDEAPRRRGSRAPSTPRRSKLKSGGASRVKSRGDSEPAHDAYQRLGREGVLPSYVVPRDVCEERDWDEQIGRPIQAAEVCEKNLNAYGPYFHGLDDEPRVTLEYPNKGASEEFILLASKDKDEYDPIGDLLSTVHAIVLHYLTSEQQSIFGRLDSLETASTAGQVLSGANLPTPRSRSTSVLGGPLGASGEPGSPSRTSAAGSGLGDDSLGSPARPGSDVIHQARVGTSLTYADSPAYLSPAKAAVLASASPAPSPVSMSHAESDGSSLDPDPILRSFTKARNRRDGPLFVRTVARFNAALCKLKDDGAINRNIRKMHGVPEGVWRVVQEQGYARTVGPKVEELSRYEAFSDNVYGELLPRFMSEIAQLTSLGPNSTFVDLGSGVGNLLVQASLQTGCTSYGCEMMGIPSALADAQLAEARKRWRMWGLKGARCDAWQGDFGESDRVKEVLGKADVVLVNNYAFLPRTNEKLSLLFLDLPDGAHVVSLKPFVPPDFRLTERTLSSPLAILRVVERTYGSGCVSWADGGGKYYIQTVDRSIVRDFEQRLLHAPNGRWETSKRRWKARIESDDE